MFILSARFGLSPWTHVFRDWPLLVFILNHVFAKHGRSWSKSCTLHLLAPASASHFHHAAIWRRE